MSWNKRINVLFQYIPMAYSVKIHLSIYFYNSSFFPSKKMMSKNRFRNVAIEDTFAQLIIKQARKSIYFFKKSEESVCSKWRLSHLRKGNVLLQSLITNKNNNTSPKALSMVIGKPHLIYKNCDGNPYIINLTPKNKEANLSSMLLLC